MTRMKSFGRLILAFAMLTSATAQARTVVDGQAKNWEVFSRLYPKRALDAGEHGLVAFKLTLDRKGHPTACQVTHTSGYPRLDAETCEILLMHVEYQRPKGADGQNLAIFHTEGVLNWRLPNGKANLKSPAKLAVVDPSDKKVCKRQLRTGSLAGWERVCMTAREWDRGRAETRTWLEQETSRGHTRGN